MNSPEELKYPALIALTGGVIAAILGYLMSGITAQMLSSGPAAGMGAFIGVIAAISAFFGFFLVWWIIMAGIVFLLSMAFSGKGTFKRTLEFMGFGLIPIIIGSILSLLVSLYYLPLVQAPVISSYTDPTVMQQAVTQLMNDPAMLEYTQISTIISAIFLIWSANIWIFAIRHARTLSLKHALITVVIPVIIYLIYMGYVVVTGVPVPGGA